MAVKSKSGKKNSGNSEFAKEMAEMNGAWTDAPDNSDLPEGVYSMIIQSAEVKRTKTSGKLRATFQFVVAEGEHEGASQYDGFMLDGDSPVGMSMLKQLISKLGYEVPEDFSDVNDVLNDITNANPLVSGEVKRKGDFTNVRVLELLEAADGSDEGATDDDDDDAVEDTDGAEDDEAGEEAEEGEEEGEEESEDDEVEEVELAVGVAVSLEVEGDTYQGAVKKIRKNGNVDVETDEEVFEDVEPDLLTIVTEEGEEEGEDTEQATAVELAAAHGIDGIEDDTPKAKALNILRKQKWNKDELTDEEIEFLTDVVGIEFPAKKKPTAAPAKKGAPIGKKPAPAAAKKPISKKPTKK